MVPSAGRSRPRPRRSPGRWCRRRSRSRCAGARTVTRSSLVPARVRYGAGSSRGRRPVRSLPVERTQPKPVEAVERLDLPVERLVRLHVQQRRAVARPVERPVAVVPVEASTSFAAEPVPRTGSRSRRSRRRAAPPRAAASTPDRQHAAQRRGSGLASRACAAATATPPRAASSRARGRAARPGRAR